MMYFSKKQRERERSIYMTIYDYLQIYARTIHESSTAEET